MLDNVKDFDRLDNFEPQNIDHNVHFFPRGGGPGGVDVEAATPFHLPGEDVAAGLLPDSLTGPDQGGDLRAVVLGIC